MTKIMSPLIICDVCQSANATVFCGADSANLCPSCDNDIHSANKLSRRHVRQPLPSLPNSKSSTPSTCGDGDTMTLKTPSPTQLNNHRYPTSQQQQQQQQTWTPLSLEMIASACIRREAEALSESSGFVVPPTYIAANAANNAAIMATEDIENRKAMERQKATSKLKSKRDRTSKLPTNNSNRVRYESRKAIADSRPRVKGRFVGKQQQQKSNKNAGN